MDKADLFKRRADTESGMPEDDVDVPGIGKVRVRALTRREALDTGTIEHVAERTMHIIALAMVDPKMTVSDVRRWANVALANELDAVDTRVAELSGLLPDSAKAAYKSNGDGPDAGVRSVPGGETWDDGSPHAGGAE